MNKEYEFYKEFKDYSKVKLNNAFINACLYNDLDKIKYLLTSSELKENANIHARNDEGFRTACGNGHLEIVKYLLTSPELKEHADIHASDDSGFTLACLSGHLNIIKYFIFDMSIDKTEKIQNYLTILPDEQIENMFKIRELNKQLESELNSNKNSHKKLKI